MDWPSKHLNAHGDSHAYSHDFSFFFETLASDVLCDLPLLTPEAKYLVHTVPLQAI